MRFGPGATKCAPPILAALVALLGGCGLTYSRLPEPWDAQADPDAVYHLEAQVKNAIYCELKWAAIEARARKATVRRQGNIQVSGPEDAFLPDSWGVLVQLQLQADEKSSLTPGVAFKDPLPNQQSFSLGFGGQLSSQNIRYDKYNFFYSARDLAVPFSPGGPCRPDFNLGPKSSSSPFLNAANLGIREWLVTAVRVIDFNRSSRVALNGQGKPLGPQGPAINGGASDSSTYSNKFVIISDASIAPSWNLVRIGTPASPLFDVNRTRTHELIMTVGPGNVVQEAEGGRRRALLVNIGPSDLVRDAHNAALIGSAVANAIRP